MTTGEPTSVVVVGAGLAGAATAWRLADRGHRVTVLERSTPANRWGSSSGSARIFRYAYADPLYIDLVVRAHAGWQELARQSGVAVVTTTGSVDFGLERDPELLADLLTDRGVEHTLLTREAASQRWPIAFDSPVLFHPGAGVVDAATAVDTMLGLAVARGAQVIRDSPVAHIEQAGSGYRVLTEAGAVQEAEQVVVAAGGWLPDLLGDLPVPVDFLAQFPTLDVRQQQVHHFPFRDAGAAWPTFIYKSATQELYGLPGGRDAGFRGMKVAEHDRGRPLASAADHDQQVDPEAQERVTRFVRDFMPGLVPEPYAVSTCLYTNTPDHDFVLDRVDGITVLSPCSGHGAKFAPVLGELAADLVEGRGSVPSRFRPSQLASR